MADAPKPYNSYPIKTPNGVFMAHFYGTGNAYALAIHGFGQDGHFFKTLSEQYPKLTICAIDLPWHGETEWYIDSFNLRDFDPIIKFLDTQGSIHLIGFSMGCRIAIALSQIHPRLTRSMTLLSPDGISGPYHFITEYIPRSLRKRLGEWLQNPQWLLDASKTLYDGGLLKRFPAAFVQKHLKDPQNRNRLFKTWQSLPNFPVTLGANVDTPTTFIVGERDPLVKVESIRKFAQLLTQHKVYTIDRKHDLFPLPPGMELFK